MRFRTGRLAALALLLAAGPASPQVQRPPQHSPVPPPLFSTASEFERIMHADAGLTIERDRAPAAELDEHRRLTAALGQLQPQRRGIVDAYVIAIALDSDPVFAREAREAGAVLARRYGAAGRTIVLAGPDGNGADRPARGTPASFALALARIAELADRSEDALIVYVTSHGMPFGLYYHDGDSGYGAISPNRLRNMLDQLGLANRLLILSACYSGVFVPALRSNAGAIVTASASDRTSFGCVAENDWTFFGDAMINRALRKPQPLAAAFAEASGLVADWEGQLQGTPSQPQYFAGPLAARWLDALEARMPRTATPPAGRPALETTRAATGR